MDQILIVTNDCFGKSWLVFIVGGMCLGALAVNLVWCNFLQRGLGVDFFSFAMLEFSDFISIHILIDLPLEGGTFTWSNSREAASQSRLEKFLLSSNLEEHFSNNRQKRLHRLLSNHFPVLLEGENFHEGNHPFYFKNIWLKAEGFVEKVRTWWESYHFQDSPSFWIARKLKVLKLDVKKWNEEEFGNVEDKMNKLWKDLEELDLMEDSCPLTNYENLEK